MEKNSRRDVNMNNSNVNVVVNEETSKRVANKVKSTADAIADTSLTFDSEESETPKKRQVFDSIRELFGFEVFNENEFADTLMQNGIKYSELKNEIAKERKRINSVNEKRESFNFEDVCEIISKSDLLSDVSLFLGTKDLLSLKPILLTSENKVVLFHGKQSEESEKFETYNVSIKGLHKPYKDICYVSYLEMNTSNILRGLRNYGYYLASLNRCKRQKKEETTLFDVLKDTVLKLHKNFGYMPNDFDGVFNF